jgi:hypothetical protein
MPRTNLRDEFTPEQRATWKPKIIARNTFRYFVPDGPDDSVNGETVTRLHHTDIVRRLSNGSIVLHSGGWKTVTTKDRMNQCLPAGYGISQTKGLWYVWKAHNEDRIEVPYYDGIVVPDCFNPTLGKHMEGVMLADKETKLRKQITKFVNKLDKLRKLPEPNGGNCWLCCMRDQNGKTWGDHSAGNDHILKHIKEGYLHGSLIYNALVWAGYTNLSFIWQLGNTKLDRGEKPDIIKRALRRYLLRKCGLAA